MAFSNSPQYSTYQQKMVPFYSEPLLRSGGTLKDQRMYNCFPESYKTAATDQRQYYLKKRFGLSVIRDIAPGEIRGAVSFETQLFWIAGNNFYSYDGITPPALRGTIGVTSGPVTLIPYDYQGDGQTYLLISDGVTIYTYHLQTAVFAFLPAGYPTPHSPYIETMDGYILATKNDSADMYSSQATDWTQPWDTLSAEMYPDRLLGLRKFNNYIMAIGTESMEMFYDAAIEDGSPFARNDSVIATIGCRAIATALQTDRKFLWLGTTQEGDASVWSMDEFKPTEIATPAVKMAITADPNLQAAKALVVRVQGHQFYVLRLTNVTWVYDINERIWHQWTYQENELWPVIFGGEQFPGRFYGLMNGLMVWFDDSTGTDLSVFPINCTWETEPHTFDTMNRKFLHRLTLIGDISGTSTAINVQWSDDDYQTFSANRTIPMNKNRPAIVNCGYFRRRAFRFSCTTNTPMRLEGMELNINTGVN